MKIKNFLLIFVSIILTSCVFTEEIHINSDGSGKYAFKMDMSGMMESMNEMSKKDSLKKSEKIDSIILFKDILSKNKDSIAKLSKSDQEIIKSLEELKLHMLVDEENNKMNMNFIFDFKNIADLKNIEERIKKAQTLSDKKKKKEEIPSKTSVEYSFNNNTFKRIVLLKNLTEEELNTYNETVEQGASMFDETIYRIVYHFQDNIKSVSFDGAKISDDKKTLTIEIPMDSIMKNPLLLNFEVKLK